MQNARRSNYMFSVGEYQEAYSAAPNMGWAPTSGVRAAFLDDISTTFAEITDGLSNTFLVGESPQNHYSTVYGPYWGSGVHTAVHGVIYPPSNANYPEWLPNGNYNPAPPATNLSHLLYAWTLGSKHPGGLNMVMGDGSVRFVKNSVSPQTWWAAATIAGGEIISADQF
jgi:prepilin-type processing-associated H-X9-DG protein